MNNRRTYTVIIPATSLTPGTRREVSGVQRFYFDTKRALLEFCTRAAANGRTLHIAVQSYVSLAKGLAGSGALLDYATFSTESGLVLHGLTLERETMLRRYLPAAK